METKHLVIGHNSKEMASRHVESICVCAVVHM